MSLWLNTDPLSGYNPIQETEHYIDGQHNGGVFNPMNHNTYGYTYNNPVIYVDPNGKQSISNILVGKVITPSNASQKEYSFTESAIHILSKVSGVNKKNINSAVITYSNASNYYLPYYDKFSSSQGALVLPLKKNTIIYNKGLFDSSVKNFMSLSSHEVGHIPQANYHENNLFSYISTFMMQYILEGGHDEALYEKRADVGSIMFDGFIDFTDRFYGKNSFEKLYNNKKNTQNSIINRFDQWWKQYKKSPEYNKSSEEAKNILIESYKK